MHYLYNITAICNNNHNEVINTNFGRLNNLILIYKIPMVIRKMSLKCLDNLETPLKKDGQAW